MGDRNIIDGNGDETSSSLLFVNLAMKASKPVINEAGEVIWDMATIDNKAQCDHVCELVLLV